jgi:toxin-antitoxin system PIN domain toxin
VTLADVNVLLQAFRRDSPEHVRCHAWLDGILRGDSPFGVSPQVLSSVVRITTHTGFQGKPETPASALAFCRDLLERPHSITVLAGPGHWEIFRDLCIRTGARGNLVPDAWFAALAIEHGCEWISLDRDFARFPGLRWREP